MRLLNAFSLTFTEFFDSQIPPYLILSHTWTSEECTLQTFPALRSQPDPPPGISKILRLAGLAREQGVNWIWVDTCCIDKTSSAELSEAINSMFRWYRDAYACFVFLEDVRDSTAETRRSDDGLGAIDRPIDEPTQAAIRNARWFTRGFCLQELLAPKTVYFFDNEWRFLGGLAGSVLMELVSQATGIKKRYLNAPEKIFKACVAERMSWAAGRKTSRLEDRAYSLLGIFNVNMPLLYGEGIRAFRRLQKEIILEIDDESIFAWWLQDLNETEQEAELQLRGGGVLAQSPDDFRHSREILPSRMVPRPPVACTSRGLQIYTGGHATVNRERLGYQLVRLNCLMGANPQHVVYLILRDRLSLGKLYRLDYKRYGELVPQGSRKYDYTELTTTPPLYLTL